MLIACPYKKILLEKWPITHINHPENSGYVKTAGNVSIKKFKDSKMSIFGTLKKTCHELWFFWV